VKTSIDFEQALNLRQRWASAQSNYEDRLSSSFADIRLLLSQSEDMLDRGCIEFLQVLNDHDETANKLVSKFIESWKQENKGRLLRIDRLDEGIDALSDQLWNLAERKRGLAEDLASRMSTPVWLRDIEERCNMDLSTLVDAEQERFVAITELLDDAEGINEFIKPPSESTFRSNDVHEEKVEPKRDHIFASTALPDQHNSSSITILTSTALQGMQHCFISNRPFSHLLRDEFEMVKERFQSLASIKLHTIQSVKHLMEAQQRRFDFWIGKRLQNEDAAISHLCNSLKVNLVSFLVESIHN
jgi:hypothetical protein